MRWIMDDNGGEPDREQGKKRNQDPTSKSRLRSDGSAFPACCASEGEEGMDASPPAARGSSPPSTARSLRRSPMVSSGPPTPRISAVSSDEERGPHLVSI
jgi:hypothetical protein